MESRFTKEEIIANFHKSLEKNLTVKDKKKNPQYINALFNIKPEDLILNEVSAKIVIGHTKSNGTAVGNSGDYERTINRDITSPPAVFLVKGSYRAAQAAVLSFDGSDDEYYSLDERGIENNAYDWNRFYCKRDLKDLNYNMEKFRLNRHSFYRDSEEFDFLSINISTKIKNQKGIDTEINLGVIYPSDLTNTDKQYLQFDTPTIQKTKKAKIIKALLICGAIALVIGDFAFMLIHC